MTTESSIFVALDIGSSSIKAAVMRRNMAGEGRWISSRRWATPSPSAGLSPGRHETDAAVLLAAVRNAIEELCEEYGPALSAIGFSTQMHGVILTDSLDHAVSPFISWQDNRALETRTGGGSHLDEVRERTGPDLFENTGLNPRPGLGAINAHCWLAMNPHAAGVATRVHTLGSFLMSAFTGQYVTHVTNAAALGVMDLRASGWHSELVRALGLDHLQFPRIEHEFRAVGSFQGPSGAVTVYPDVGDHQAAVYGSRHDDPGTVSISLGTAGIAARTAAELVPSSRYEVRPYLAGRYLNTVTRLPGGRHFDTVLGLLHAAGRDVFDISEPWQDLRSWVATTMTGVARGGGGPVSACDVREEAGGSQLTLTLPVGTDVPAEGVLRGLLEYFGERYRAAVTNLFGAHGNAPTQGALNGGMAIENEWLPPFLADRLGIPFALVKSQDLALAGVLRLLEESAGSTRVTKHEETNE